MTDYESHTWLRIPEVATKEMGLMEEDPKITGFTVINGDLLILATETRVYRRFDWWWKLYKGWGNMPTQIRIQSLLYFLLRYSSSLWTRGYMFALLIRLLFLSKKLQWRSGCYRYDHSESNNVFFKFLLLLMILQDIACCLCFFGVSALLSAETLGYPFWFLRFVLSKSQVVQ